jgi:arabinogalactan endo-1,4-beta-galactosidase
MEIRCRRPRIFADREPNRFPAWDLTDFFTLAQQNGIPFDAICQSYYPIFHGPLTSAQAAASNPNQQPIEQAVLNAGANSIAKPIFIIETAKHYENGFQRTIPGTLRPARHCRVSS